MGAVANRTYQSYEKARFLHRAFFIANCLNCDYWDLLIFVIGARRKLASSLLVPAFSKPGRCGLMKIKKLIR